MALPKIVQKLFSDEGKGSKLRPDIVPTTMNGNSPDPEGNFTPDQTGCLPLSGGTMTGAITTPSDGALSWTNGAYKCTMLLAGEWGTSAGLSLRSKDATSETGFFNILAANSAQSKLLQGRPDGTLQWDGNNILTAANGLPKNGGEITGTIKSSTVQTITQTGTFNATGIYGGTSWQNGAYIALYGKDNTGNPGYVGITAQNGTESKTLQLRPDGMIQWGSDKVITSAGGNFNNAVYFNSRGHIRFWNGSDFKYTALYGYGDKAGGFEAFDEDCPTNPSGFNCRARGANGEFYDLSGRKDGELYWKGNKVSVVNLNGHTFIRYSDGTQICWGRIDVQVNQSSATQTFPCAFANTDYAITITTLDDNVTSYPFNIGTRTTTGFTAWCRSTNQFGRAATWMAIGRWW